MRLSSGVSPDSTEHTRRRTSEYRWRYPGNMEMELVISGLVSQMMEDLRPWKVSWFQERSFLWSLAGRIVLLAFSFQTLDFRMAWQYISFSFSFMKKIKANEWKLTENPRVSVKRDLARKPFAISNYPSFPTIDSTATVLVLKIYQHFGHLKYFYIF